MEGVSDLAFASAPFCFLADFLSSTDVCFIFDGSEVLASGFARGAGSASDAACCVALPPFPDLVVRFFCDAGTSL